MLTIYEQVQQSVDFIETHLPEPITSAVAARAAGMSPRSFHRYFLALTGYRVGEYVRKRRLTRAMQDLLATDASVLEIAIRVGYGSHEGFTRAFKKVFGAAPRAFRNRNVPGPHTERIELVGEIDMGVLKRPLPTMNAVCFRGFRPEPEMTAFEAMEAWMKRHPEALGSHRIFGRNIDMAGHPASDPDNEGYELLLTVPDSFVAGDDGALPGRIDAGLFVVTGIEGSFEEDPSGSWIGEGWRRLQDMVERNHLRVHLSHRWFEERLEPVERGRTRFDLYLEITG